MTNKRPRSPRLGAAGHRRYLARQRGQALIYGMFVLVGGLAGLFFLFNAGQLVREKTKLVNTADAVAYSAGVMNARALNFQAYGNRAMVANTVAIGQLVSLSSWVAYADTLGTFGGTVVAQPKYVHFLSSYYVAANTGSYLQLLNAGPLELLAKGSDAIIQDVLKPSQEAVYNGLLPARHTVMNEVARANYTGDGAVVVDAASLLDADYRDFIDEYSGSKRERFKKVVETAANKDAFVPSRSWSLTAIFPSACLRFDRLQRLGGTRLLGLDEWRALDTLSERTRKWRSFQCRRYENEAGWGGRSAGDDASGESDWLYYDQAKSRNQKAASLATGLALMSGQWDYRGLPAFYDLAGGSDGALQQPDPRLQLAIRVRRDRDQTATSEGRSGIRGGTRLNTYRAALNPGDDLVAVSASEAFFERKDDNVHGRRLGRPAELGSLFNPFWHVRLIHSPEGVARAQAAKGVSLGSH